jgi:hypothetical protein
VREFSGRNEVLKRAPCSVWDFHLGSISLLWRKRAGRIVQDKLETITGDGKKKVTAENQPSL